MTPPFPNAPVPNWYRRGQWKAAFSKRNGVHYVGDDVIIDLTFPTASYDTFKRTAIFDNGTDGATISTSQRGYYSEVASVTGTPTYSSTHAYGPFSLKIPSGVNQNVQWQYANSTSEHLRFYLYATANPGADSRLLGGQTFTFTVNTSGKLQLFDSVAAGTTFATSIALNQWVRIEAHLDYANDIFEGKLFNDPDSTSPTETKALNPANMAGNQLATIGNHAGSNWGSDLWFDNVVLGASSYPGPYDPDEAIASPVTYTIRDFYGNIVSTGTFDEYQSWFRPTIPAGGWLPGWYRVYLTGAQSDANFYDSYGATNFCVIRDDSHFITMPTASTPDGSDSAMDLVMKGVMGMGTSRISVTDAANPDIPTLQSDVAITQAYWSDNGIPDSERPSREPWIDFPNGTSSAPQQAGVTAVVAALYPDVKYFEGPSNEPTMGAGTAAEMATFAAAVHSGNADAQAIGPAFVNISDLAGWEAFLAAGGGDHCDGISFHAYNAVVNGDMNLGKYTIDAFLALLTSYNLENKLLWQTESVHGFTPVYRVYHPRRARRPLMETLLFEQKGVPRERNNQWYDVSNGFWDFPSWIENGDGSLEPQAVLTRVLAEETWGMPFIAPLDFGTPGNSIFLGNLYRGTNGSTVALMTTSFIDGASVTLSIGGTAGPVNVVDGFGRVTSTYPSQGRVQIGLTEVPSYLELPVGATANVYRVNDWPLGYGIGASVSSSASTKEIDGVSYTVIADNGYMTNYGAGGIAPTTYATPPSVTRLLWTSRTIERVIVWCGPSWQSSGTLITFDVQTTTDGTNWTTRRTISKPALSYFNFGTDSTNSGCFVETYWDEQWIFDIKLPAPVTCTGVRLNVTAASYGGEPLSDGGGQLGQGAPVQAYRIQEIAAFPDTVVLGTPVITRGRGAA